MVREAVVIRCRKEENEFNVRAVTRKRLYLNFRENENIFFRNRKKGKF